MLNTTAKVRSILVAAAVTEKVDGLEAASVATKPRASFQIVQEPLRHPRVSME